MLADSIRECVARRLSSRELCLFRHVELSIEFRLDSPEFGGRWFVILHQSPCLSCQARRKPAKNGFSFGAGLESMRATLGSRPSTFAAYRS